MAGSKVHKMTRRGGLRRTALLAITIVPKALMLYAILTSQFLLFTAVGIPLLALTYAFVLINWRDSSVSSTT